VSIARRADVARLDAMLKIRDGENTPEPRHLDPPGPIRRQCPAEKSRAR
jgi:hypothetical protein